MQGDVRRKIVSRVRGIRCMPIHFYSNGFGQHRRPAYYDDGSGRCKKENKKTRPHRAHVVRFTGNHAVPFHRVYRFPIP